MLSLIYFNFADISIYVCDTIYVWCLCMCCIIQVLGFTRAQLSPAVLLKGRVHALKDVPVQYRRVYTEITLRGL